MHIFIAIFGEGILRNFAIRISNSDRFKLKKITNKNKKLRKQNFFFPPKQIN